MSAQQAIDKINSAKTIYMGIEVEKYATAYEKRKELQKIAEKNEISPIEYKKALDITWTIMTPGEKRRELEYLW